MGGRSRGHPLRALGTSAGRLRPQRTVAEYQPSSWRDPLDALAQRVLRSYETGGRGASLDGVKALMAELSTGRPRQRIVVVGTNGKTSVATMLARLLTAAGRSTGLYTSPHLRTWSERIRVDLEPVADGVFEQALTRAHDTAQRVHAGELRFFDVLTVAADEIFVRAGVEFAVYEAGIGGRLDATRALEPQLVLLTSIGDDHRELLGETPEQRLTEKALAAGSGATLISQRLDPALEARLIDLAQVSGFDLKFVASADAGASAFQQRNLALARAGFEWLLAGVEPPPISTDIDGRFQRGEAGGVPYIVDVGHNVTAWTEFLSELAPTPHVLVVAITKPRPVADLVAAIDAARDRVATVITTTTAVRPAQPPEAIAVQLERRGIESIALPDRPAAFALAVELARERSLPLAVVGSNFVALEFLAWTQQPSM
jgi:dihydrofolate synthase/folylpolyglutamate synthase